jgi:hypothetical protein
MFEIIPKLEQRKLGVVTKQILALTNALMFSMSQIRDHKPNPFQLANQSNKEEANQSH